MPSLLASRPQVLILDIAKSPYQWVVPIVKSETGAEPPNLLFHTATLVENYMIVAFGNLNLFINCVIIDRQSIDL